MSLETQPPEPVPQRTPAPISVGRIVSTSLAALQVRMEDMLAIAVFFVLIPAVLLGFAPQDIRDPALMFWNFMAALPALVFDGAGALILYGALTGGQGPTAIEAIRAAAMKLSDLLVVILGGSLVIAVGLFLLVAPGLFVTACVLVATPVLMVEKTSALDAFRRSMALSRGSRWRLVGVACLLTATVVGAMVLMWSLLSIAVLASTQEIALRVGAFVIAPVVGVGIRMIIIAVVTGAYVELRRAHGETVPPPKAK